MGWNLIPGFLKDSDTSPPADRPPTPSKKPSSPPALDHVGGTVDFDSFVELSDGYTHYERTGYEGDPLVVLVHGLTTSHFIWDYQMTALRRCGFQVLRYDLYGRGLSDRPDTRYEASLFHRQLKELIEATVDEPPRALVGLSLGGAIVVGATARKLVNPDRLFLVAPAGLRNRMPWWFYLAVLPGVVDLLEVGVGNWFWSVFGPRNLSADPEKRERARRRMNRQLSFSGFHRALLSTLRHGPLYGQRRFYRALSRRSVPLRAIWSREDTVVPPRMAGVLKELVPHAEVSTVRAGRHTVNYDRPELVNPALLDFLSR